MYVVAGNLSGLEQGPEVRRVIHELERRRREVTPVVLPVEGMRSSGPPTRSPGWVRQGPGVWWNAITKRMWSDDAGWIDNRPIPKVTQLVKAARVSIIPTTQISPIGVNQPSPTSLPAPGPLPVMTDMPIIGRQLPTFIDVAQAETNPMMKWGLLALGAFIFFSSADRERKKTRRRRRRR